MSSKIFEPLVLFVLVILSSFLSSNVANAHGHIAMPTEKNAAGKIAVYWGQGNGESSLEVTCSSGNYDIVVIAFLGIFGKGQKPELTLGDHCKASTNDCQRLANEIRSCQSKYIKVLLSVGGPPGGYSLSTDAEAIDFADYLWNNFLGGNSTSRPFGDAILQGIDFDIRGGNLTYVPVVLRLNNHGASGKGLVWVSISSPCVYPTIRLLDVVQRCYIDYIFVQFYNVYGTKQQCEYDSEDESIYIDAWKWWESTSSKYSKIFFGTLASLKAGSSGYIPPNVFASRVLHFIKESPKYGGVMLWNQRQDNFSGYASTIKSRI